MIKFDWVFSGSHSKHMNCIKCLGDTMMFGRIGEYGSNDIIYVDTKSVIEICNNKTGADDSISVTIHRESYEDNKLVWSGTLEPEDCEIYKRGNIVSIWYGFSRFGPYSISEIMTAILPERRSPKDIQ